MTPSYFETKAREAAKQSGVSERMKAKACCEGCEEKYFQTGNFQHKHGFELGAQWSRTETIAEILGMLRSKDAPTAKDCRRLAEWLWHAAAYLDGIEKPKKVKKK